MKKTAFAAAAFCVALVLAGCASAPSAEPDPRLTSGTPENSVFIYGCYFNAGTIAFSQMDPKFGPDYDLPDVSHELFVAPGIFVLGPVAPGSRYSITYISGSAKRGSTEYYYSSYEPMQGTILDITVPNKPGIYYAGTYDLIDTVRNGKKTEVSGIGFNQKDGEKQCLVYAGKKVKGTPWEAAIAARLAELEGKK